MRWIVILGLIALAVLCVLSPYCRAPVIQEDIRTRTGAELIAAGFDGEVSVTGRDVTLTGTVSTQETRTRLGEVAAGVRGVRTVDNQLQVVAAPVGAQPMPGELELVKQGSVLTLRGAVPNELARVELVSRAIGLWGEGNVIDELVVDPTLGPWPDWLGRLTDALIMRRGDLVIVLSDRTARAEGMVLSELTEDRILGAVAALTPGFEVVDQIEIREPTNDLERLQVALDLRLRGKVVEFASDSAELTANGRAVLDEVAAAVRAAPGQVLIGGHTDHQASHEYNLGLSLDRAEAVRDYLVASEIDAERFVTIGYGKTSPIATNQTAEGRQRNRRTEFHVLEEN